MYETEAMKQAAVMVGADAAGLLHHALVDTIKQTETWCSRAGVELDGTALAVLIMAWRLANPDARMVGE